MKLSKTEQKVIDSLNKHKNIGYKQTSYDRIQHGIRFMKALFSLMSKGLVVELKRETDNYDQRKGIGRTAYYQQTYVISYTVRLSDNS
jgi:hypothetical protein